jgi:hypothetical protein
MSSKKYYLVKDEKSQDGGVVPIKVINGAPIIKLGQLTPSTVSMVNVRSVSPDYEYNFRLPYNIIRPFVNDVYRFRYPVGYQPSTLYSPKMMLPSKYGYPYSEKKGVQLLINGPRFKRTVYLPQIGFLRMLRRMQDAYRISPTITDRTGSPVQVVRVLRNLQPLVRTAISDTEYDEIYNPLKF